MRRIRIMTTANGAVAIVTKKNDNRQKQLIDRNDNGEQNQYKSMYNGKVYDGSRHHSKTARVVMTVIMGKGLALSLVT